jgi:23S rRNA pseudouridine1911/1915/1917 synthase
MYGGRGARALPHSGTAREFPRQALHATEIEFPHPSKEETVRVSSPLPADLRDLLRELRDAEAPAES